MPIPLVPRVMAVGAAGTAVSVQRTVAVLEPRKGVEEMDGSETEETIETPIMFVYHVDSVSMEGRTVMGGLVAEGGVAEVDDFSFRTE